MTVATPLAQSVVGGNGWWLIFASPGDEKRRDLGQTLVQFSRSRVDIGSVGHAGSSRAGTDLRHCRRFRPADVRQKFSALFSGKVTSSTLGLISMIGLGLGFVIAVSSFLAAVQERRREFGIMSSIGLADHIVRPEDWPVMPCAYTGFRLKPLGFFDGNPALDIPPSPPKACHHH